MPERVHTKFEEPQDSQVEHIPKTSIFSTDHAIRKSASPSRHHESYLNSVKHISPKPHGIKRNRIAPREHSSDLCELPDSPGDIEDARNAPIESKNKRSKVSDESEPSIKHDDVQSFIGESVHRKERRLCNHTPTFSVQGEINAVSQLEEDIMPQLAGRERKSSSSSSSGVNQSTLKGRPNPKSARRSRNAAEAGAESSTENWRSMDNNDAIVQPGLFRSKDWRGNALSRPKASLLREAAERLRRGRETLPIFVHKAELRQQIRENDVLIVVGETGSGKSTQLPQFLSSEPWLRRRLVNTTNDAGKVVDFNVGGTIAVTEPRRLAATSLAMRVAKEQGSHIGRNQMDDTDTVGYSIRFDHLVPKNVKIVFLTEGMLLQELQRDPHLRKYSAVIVDEIHERSINVDLLGGFLKTIVHSDNKGRGHIPLKVIIMSATANVVALQEFFSTIGKEGMMPRKLVAEEAAKQNPGANETSSKEISSCKVAVHQIPGKQHDVKVLFTPIPVKDYVQSMLETIFKIHMGEPLPGDILGFLTGQDEIELLQTQIEEYASSMSSDLPRLKVLPLYAQMSSEQQQEAFRRTKDRTRKVVLATNVAETSVTVPGVRFVIDCGKVKLKEHRHRLGMDSLLIRSISKSSAIQRKGRAGREAAGKCFRLYTEEEYSGFADADVPEILRSNVESSVLSMKACKVRDVHTFPLMDPPDPTVLDEAMQTLHIIGALDGDTELSSDGRKMAQLPLNPSYAKALLAASEPGMDCLLEAIDVVACLSAGDDIFRQPRTEEERERTRDARQDLVRREGDLVTILTTMQRYACEAGSNRAEWCQNRLVSARNMRQALDIRRQLRKLCVQMKLTSHAAIIDTEDFTPITPDRAESLIKCFLQGLPFETAFLHPDGSYRTFRGRHVISIHPSSVLHGKKLEAIMYAEHIFTGKNYARKVSAIQMQWMIDVTTGL